MRQCLATLLATQKSDKMSDSEGSNEGKDWRELVEYQGIGDIPSGRRDQQDSFIRNAR